jgi:hypothetical protein
MHYPYIRILWIEIFNAGKLVIGNRLAGLVQVLIIRPPACHARGRGFESRRSRQIITVQLGSLTYDLAELTRAPAMVVA